MKEGVEVNRTEATSYIEKQYGKVPEFKPVELGLFGGDVNYNKLPFRFRKMFEKAKNWLKVISRIGIQLINGL